MKHYVWLVVLLVGLVLAVSGGDDARAAGGRAGADRSVVDRDNNGSESVSLDGTGSSHADGTIASYQWLENGQVIATGATPTVPLAVGVHTLTLRVTDNDGLTDEDQVIITVRQLERPGADAGVNRPGSR